MRRWIGCVGALVGVLAGCSETRQVAYVPTVGESLVGVPVIQTDLFSAEVRDYYWRRIAEQSLPPGSKTTSYSYYERKSWY